MDLGSIIFIIFVLIFFGGVVLAILSAAGIFSLHFLYAIYYALVGKRDDPKKKGGSYGISQGKEVK